MKRRIDSLAQRLGRIPTGWWVAFLTLPALLPLLRVGFFDSHDGLFHVYRLKALDQAVRAGVLYPRWFPDFAFGYGHPVLNFYSPLSYYWGLPFTLLGADAALATKFVFVTGLLASALGMYLFARLHTERLPALVAAVVYAYLPYHLIDLYIRGAVAEFLAFIWFPIVLWVFHRLVTDSAEQSFSRIAVASCPLTAMVITHSLSAFIFAPVLVAYVVILLARQRDLQALARVAVASALALTLSAFYWFPVLTESRFVGLGHGASQGYRDHLLPLTDLFSLSLAYPYPTDAGVTPTYPLGLVQGAILLAALTLPFLSYRRRWPVVFFLTLALCSAFMLTEASLPLWRIFEPGLALLQYPWRFQMLTVLATAFLAGALFDALSNAWHASFRTWARPLVAGCLLLTAAVWALWRLSIEPTTPDLSTEAMWRTDRKHGQVGATWTGEFLPIWVREQRWALSLPAPEPAPEGTVLPAGQVRLDRVGYNRYDVILDAPQGADLVLHQFHYPGWQAVGQVA
ncbi:MAG: 6-pyruvoyl-tetrahydropterin synthase-related protein, partial [Anaerolineae bacterium]